MGKAAGKGKKRKRSTDNDNVIQHLISLLHHDTSTSLRSELASLPLHKGVKLRINAEFVIDTDQDTATCHGPSDFPQLSLGVVELKPADIQAYLQNNTEKPSPDGPATESSPPEAKAGPAQSTKIVFPADSQCRKVGDHIPEIVPDDSLTTRQLQLNSREYPQRKSKTGQGATLRPSTIDNFIAGIWKQIYSGMEVKIPSESDFLASPYASPSNDNIFDDVSALCLKLTTTSRQTRSLEILVQAYWIECYDKRIQEISNSKPLLSNTEVKMFVLREACSILKWSEKELRNRMAIWRGYKEIKDAGGWVSLVFAGSGIYRLCKYRAEFDLHLVARLGKFKSAFLVAADTIHPQWHELLKVIGITLISEYHGHPHDWVVCDGSRPVTLKSTYIQWNPDFHFTHLEHSKIVKAAWGDHDPRGAERSTIFCNECGYCQSDNPKVNECRCFPELYGGQKILPAVQVFRTPQGKNNGLLARTEFVRGCAIGEFVGEITQCVQGKDVMQGGAPPNQYQIYQGHMGNYLRFVNHSCKPNTRFQKFCWLGLERIILVSCGVEAQTEITVDYSHDYWEGLDKVCLCGQSCCRYPAKPRSNVQQST